jgi:hypothetical protein
MSKREREESPLTSDEIVQIINDIVASNASTANKKSIFRKKYPEFIDRYPVLFDMATQPNFDMGRLQMMLRLRDSVTTNNITQFDASAKVGKELYDAYVKDNIPNENKK